MPSLNFSFNLTPVAKGRPRMSRYGHAYTPKKTREYEDSLISSLRSVLPKEFKPLTGAIDLECIFQFKRPKSAPKSRKDHTVRPDLDNLIKAVKDAFNGEVWHDDSQVIVIFGKKEYSHEDKVSVQVRY